MAEEQEPNPPDEEEALDLAAELGASAETSTQVFSVYVPDRDRNGNELADQRSWVLAVAEVLARVGGGVTIMPPVEGGWLSAEGSIVWETPIVVYTFVKPEPFVDELPALRRLLHQLGREPTKARSPSSSTGASTGSWTSIPRETAMAKRLRDYSQPLRRLRDEGPALRRVRRADVAEGVGAEDAGPSPERGGPITLASLYRELSERLRSTGGRPSLEGVTRRQKIPLSDEEWSKLARLAARLGRLGSATTPSQVASVLLHRALEEVDESDPRVLLEGRD